MSQLKGSWHPNLVTLVTIKDSLCNYPKRQRKITLYRDLSGQNKTWHVSHVRPICLQT